MAHLLDIVQFTGLLWKIRSTKLQTLVPMCVIDKRESGEQSRLGFLVAMWAVRRAGKAQSDHVDCHLRLCTVHAVLKNAQHVRQMCCASLHTTISAKGGLMRRSIRLRSGLIRTMYASQHGMMSAIFAPLFSVRFTSAAMPSMNSTFLKRLSARRSRVGRRWASMNRSHFFWKI